MRAGCYVVSMDIATSPEIKPVHEYGPILDFDDLGHAMAKYIDERAYTFAMYGDTQAKPRLLGLTWRLVLSQPSINIKQPLYTGKMWLRFDRKLVGDPRQYIRNQHFHVGAGGYSTYGGPWNDLGLMLSQLETGMPHELRRPLEAYAFQCYFHLKDYPDIDQYLMMQKLADCELPEYLTFDWQRDDVSDKDEKHIIFVKMYQKRSKSS